MKSFAKWGEYRNGQYLIRKKRIFIFFLLKSTTVFDFLICAKKTHFILLSPLKNMQNLNQLQFCPQ